MSLNFLLSLFPLNMKHVPQAITLHTKFIFEAYLIKKKHVEYCRYLSAMKFMNMTMTYAGVSYKETAKYCYPADSSLKMIVMYLIQ